MESIKEKYANALLRIRGIRVSHNMAGHTLALLGVVSISLGLFLISIPLGFILSGIMAIVIGSQIVTNGAKNEYPS